MRELIVAAASLLLSGCARLPESYPPPPQQPALFAPGPGGLAHFVAMNDPGASAYIVRDVSLSGEPGGWRWAWRHPELRFYLPTTRDLKFQLDFVVSSAVLRHTGPMSLAFDINGKRLGETRVDGDGEHRFEKPVPAEMLVAGGTNLVSIEPDKVWFSPADNQPLSVVLLRAGFVE